MAGRQLSRLRAHRTLERVPQSGLMNLGSAMTNDRVELTELPSALINAWDLTSFGGGELTAPAQLAFSVQGRITGTAGVNRVMGDYSASDQAITFGMLATTMMMGPEDAMAQEQLLLAFLQGELGYEITGGELVISDSAGQVLVGQLVTTDADATSDDAAESLGQ